VRAPCQALLAGVVDTSGEANQFFVSGDWHDVYYQPANVQAGDAYFSVDNHQAGR
jgi:hypothetical protein